MMPLEEQQDFVSFLDRNTTGSDALREKVQESDPTRQEYRAALILAVVTDKVHVRQEVTT